jgi:predicted metal-dependent hydrolase
VVKRVNASKVHLSRLKSTVGKLVDKHSKQMGLYGVTVKITDQMPDFYWSCYGVAFKFTKTIILRRKFLELNYDKYPDAIDWLVAHELMHIKLPSDVCHGRKFARACIDYGIHPHAINNGNYIDIRGIDCSDKYKI